MTQEEPSFSIIIPVYNKANTIACCLSSCLHSDYKKFEIIVIDDGSTDSSLNQLQTINDDRLKIYTQTNQGVSVARNEGFKKATKNWVLYLDADDMLLPNALSIFKQLILKYPNYKVFTAETNRNSSLFSEVDYTKLPAEEVSMFDYWRGKFMPNAGNAVLHRDILQEFNYDARISFYEDQFLYLQIFSKYKWIYSTIPVFNHVSVTGSLSSSHHKLEVEAAYYIPEIKFVSVIQELCYHKLLSFCLWSRTIEQDGFGIQYYKKMSKTKFSKCCRIISKIDSIFHQIQRRCESK